MTENTSSPHTNIQIIELDCAYEQLDNPAIRTLFGNLLNMRKRGYSSRHRYGSLPVDTYDFIATHYIMVRDGPFGQQELLGGVRLTRLSQATRYHLPFPLMGLLNSAKATRHLRFMEKLLGQLSETPERTELTYVSAWTFDPATRSEPPEVMARLYELFCTVNVYSQPTDQKEVRLACGIPRLKTDLYITAAGYEKSADEEGELALVKQANLTDEPVIVLHLKDGHNERYCSEAKRGLETWNKRVVLKPTEIAEEKIAA